MTRSAHSRTFPLRAGVPWGLQHAVGRAAAVERGWQWLVVLALLGTIPAFYAELLGDARSLAAALAYLLGALVTAAALLHTAWRSAKPQRHLAGNPVDALLAVGLLASAALPASQLSGLSLGLRLGVSLLALWRMLWAVRPFVTRGGLLYLLLLSLGVLGLCGAGFWWLEPSVHSLADGLWLAFTTAATVGYGDLVPTTPASKIFAVFVVLLGFGVLTLVTAAIATSWIETEERRVERDILHDMRRQLHSVHEELAALRADVRAESRTAAGAPSQRQPMPLDLQQPVEQQ